MFPDIHQTGTGLLRRPLSVHHTPIDTIPTQPIPWNTESFPTHCSIPQLRAATCPERGSARGKNGLRNSECLSPSQTCPRQSVPPRRGKSPTAQVSSWKETIRQKTQALRPGAYVRRPTLYNIWYNFLIIFINNTITCIL